MTVHELPQACKRCAELAQAIRTVQAENDRQAIEIAGLQVQLRRAGAAEIALRRELQQARDEDPAADEIRQLLDHWKLRLGKNKRTGVTTKTPRGMKRWKTARSALQHWSLEECKQAVDGLALLPYVVNGRRCATGKPQERYDDIEHALGTEKRMEMLRFHCLRVQASSVEWRLWAYEQASATAEAYFQMLMRDATKEPEVSVGSEGEGIVADAA